MLLAGLVPPLPDRAPFETRGLLFKRASLFQSSEWWCHPFMLPTAMLSRPSAATLHNFTFFLLASCSVLYRREASPFLSVA